MLQFGNLTLDPANARAVFVNGQPVKLTGAEKDYLFHLAAYSGKTFSQVELLAALYTGIKPTPKIVDVIVCKIRKKLNRHNTQKADYIQTVWGKGYGLPKAEIVAKPKGKKKAA